MLALRVQAVMQQTGEIVEQHLWWRAGLRARRGVAQQAQPGSPAADLPGGTAHRGFVQPQSAGVQHRLMRREVELRRGQHRERVADRRGGQLGRRTVAARHQQRHTGRRFFEGGRQQARQHRQRRLLQVVENEHDWPRQRCEHAAKPRARVGGRLAQVLGRKVRQLHLDAQAANGLIQHAEEADQVVVVGIEPVPKKRQRARLQIGRRQHRLARARLAAEPDARAFAMSIEPVEQPLPRHRMQQVRGAQLGGRRGAFRGHIVPSMDRCGSHTSHAS